jgi:outer membrane protein assembly factor BamB
MKEKSALWFLGFLITLPLPGDGAEPASDGGWSHWRGPEANGVARSANPPLTWSETENVKWKIGLAGEGSSTPIVWGDQVFILTAVRTNRPEDAPAPKATPGGLFGITTPTHVWRYLVTAYDRHTGIVRWEQTAAEAIPHEGRHPDNTFASCSPTTDGKRLYVSFGSRGVYAYDLDGNLLWTRDLGQMETRRSFGEGSSPVVYNDTLILLWDHEGDSFLHALDTGTGKSRWKTPRNEMSNWNTPLVVVRGGVTQVIANGGYRSAGYDFENGKQLWACGGQTLNCIASPVATDDLVFCMSGFRGSALYAIPLKARGDITGTDQVAWKRDRDTPYVPSPLLYDGRLYFIKGNQNLLTSVKAESGETIIEPTRLDKIRQVYASPVGARGRVYVTGRDGVTMVLRHGPEFEVLAVNRLDDHVDASLVMVGDRVYVRGRKHLYCIGE